MKCNHGDVYLGDLERLERIVRMLNSLEYSALFSMHPRTKKRLNEYNCRINNLNAKIIESLGYPDFLLLLSKGRLMLTDSGDLQEESNILHIPCFTLRNNTEGSEAIIARSNIIGVEVDIVLKKIRELMENKELEEKKGGTCVVFGDGTASKKIVETILGGYGCV